MPPFLFWAASLAGGAAMMRWAMREARRINDELEAARSRMVNERDPVTAPRLERDPETGIYRPV